MIRPNLENFIETFQSGSTTIALVKEISADRLNPVDAFYATEASYLLESAERGSSVGRYSFLGIEPECKISIEGRLCTIAENGKIETFSEPDPLRKVEEFLKSKRYFGAGDLSPFPGGAVGYVGYDYVKHWENLGNITKKKSNFPESIFIITKYNLVFDNLMHTLKIICNVDVKSDPKGAYESGVKGIKSIEEKIITYKHGSRDSSYIFGELDSNYTEDEFCNHVEKIKGMITEGEAIQVVLSQQMSAEFSGDSFSVFRALRTVNPSPYMFFIDFDDFVVLGASPEVMVKSNNGKAILRPIAGTRKRGSNIGEDNALMDELLSDEKELAEHIMLVDLGRNDLGRIAKKGSVSVDQMMVVEKYSHVMHIVSEVSCEISDDVTVVDLLKATFPAGTVSGAPKVRAMQIIEEFEPVQRGFYAGLIGYFSYTGAFDSCIAIRTMIVDKEKLYIQAGAGIVYDSIPQKEFEETMNKAKALFTALKKGEKNGFDGG